MSLRDQILAADDRKIEPIDIPEWPGGPFYLRVWSGDERDQWESDSRTADNKLNMQHFRARVCVLSLTDDKGVRIFADADVAKVGEKSALVLDRIFDAARKLNGLGQDAIDGREKN